MEHGFSEPWLNGDDQARGGQGHLIHLFPPNPGQVREIPPGHPTAEPVTFCWMQGERDAREKLPAVYSSAETINRHPAARPGPTEDEPGDWAFE